MKKQHIQAIVFMTIVAIVLWAGYFLKSQRSKDNAHDSGITSYTGEVKNEDELNSEEAAEREGELVKAQKEQTEQGSLRQQYETLSWTGYTYTINDMRVYKSYQAYRDSDDFSGNEIAADDGLGARDHSIYVVTDIKLKNNSDYNVEYNATNIWITCLNDNDIHGYADSKYYNEEAGGKVWYFLDSVYPEIVKSEGDTIGRWEADKITLNAVEEISFTVMFPVCIWTAEISDDANAKSISGQMNPYDRFDHIKYYIMLEGGMTEPNGDIKPNVPYDVSNNKYKLFIECEPEVIE